MLRPPQALGSHDPFPETPARDVVRCVEFLRLRLIVLRRLLVEFHVNRIVHRGKLQILLLKIRDVLIVHQRQPDVVQPARQTIAAKSTTSNE